MKSSLSQLYQLNQGVSTKVLRNSVNELPFPLHPSYTKLLLISNGLYSEDSLALLEIEVLKSRNDDYEVQIYLPNYVMIGDNGGGVALLMKEGDECLYEVDMGVMDEESIHKSADNLHQFLVEFKGKTLDFRE